METKPIVYQGHFGEFTITESDRREVVVYRAGLAVAALSFALGAGLMLWRGAEPWAIQLLTPLYTLFCLSLGVSLWTIHIYMKPLHRALQALWLVGCVASLAIAHFSPEPFAQTVYQYPLTILGMGSVFAALTGIFVKEAFCFDRLETKVLTPLVPILLLGHMLIWLPAQVEQVLLAIWSILFIIFSVRKVVQPIPPDIGDKSVFAYLKQQRLERTTPRPS